MSLQIVANDYWQTQSIRQQAHEALMRLNQEADYDESDEEDYGDDDDDESEAPMPEDRPQCYVNWDAEAEECRECMYDRRCERDTYISERRRAG
jgi:hypothetical protein